MQDFEWSCKENPVQMSQEWGTSMPMDKKAQEWSLGDPSSCRLFRQWGTPVVDLFASIQHPGCPSISVWISQTGHHLGEIPCRGSGQRESVCLLTSKHHSASSGQTSKVGRGTDHIHNILARSELVPRDYATSNRAIETFSTISVAPMECSKREGNPEHHRKHPLDCLEAHITICARNGFRKEIARKVTGS